MKEENSHIILISFVLFFRGKKGSEMFSFFLLLSSVVLFSVGNKNISTT